MSSQSSTTITIRTQADNKAAQAMTRLAGATKAAADEEARRQKMYSRAEQQMRRGGGRGGSADGPFGALKGGPAAAAFAGAMVGIGLLGKVAGEAARAIDLVQNSFLTNAQKERALLDNLPLGIGSVMQSLHQFRDEISGTSEALRQIERSRQVEGLRVQQNARLVGAEANSGAAIAQARERLAGASGVHLGASPVKTGASFQSNLAYDRASRLLPLQDQAAIAAANLAAARVPGGALAASQDRLAGLYRERDRLQATAQYRIGRAGAARDRENQPQAMPWWRQALNGMAGGAVANHFIGDSRDRAGTVGATSQAELALERVMQNEKQIQEELNRQRELGVAVTEKESALRRANLGIEKEKLSLLKEQEARLSGQAGRLGSMSAPERTLGLNAARLARQVGVENLPAPLRARAQAFAPDWFANEAQKAGERTPQYQAAVREGFFEPGELRAVREQIGKVDTNVRMNVQLDTESTAKQVLEGLQPVLRDLVKSIKAEMDAQTQEQAMGRQRANASQF